MSNLLKNLLFALGLALLLWLGYVLFLRDTEEALITATGEGMSAEAAVKTQEFIVRLNELDRMRLDTSVITDSRFMSLANFRQPITDEPSGRNNPFAPLQ